MFYRFRIVGRPVALMVLTLLGTAFDARTASSSSEGDDKESVDSKSASMTVLLPPGATLELDGEPLDGKGTTRSLKLPIDESAKERSCVLKAHWKEGKKQCKVERKLKVQPGKELSIDLYPDELIAEEQTLLDLTNAERKKEGLPALKASLKLCRAARGHSANMARQKALDHTLDGKTFDQRIDDTGYQAGEAGENCAHGADAPAGAIEMWMQSDGHRGNILSGVYGEIGIGIGVTDEGERYWTQVFANSRR